MPAAEACGLLRGAFCCSAVQVIWSTTSCSGTVVGEGRQRQVGHVGIHPGAPTARNLGPASPCRRCLVAGLVSQQMRLVPPPTRSAAITHPHQVDLVPHGGVGQEMRQVRPLPCALG